MQKLRGCPRARMGLRLRHLIALLGSSPAAGLTLRAQPPSIGLAVAAAPRCSACRCAEPENGDGDGGDLGDELNRLLDTPLLDPLQSTENEPKLLRDFKKPGDKDREDLLAAMPPLEAKKALFKSAAPRMKGKPTRFTRG